MRKVCVTISTLKLPEMGLPEDTSFLARRGWYGMRDAGQAFEFAVRDHFLDHDFKQGIFTHFEQSHHVSSSEARVSGDVDVRRSETR